MADEIKMGVDIYDPYQHPEEWTPEMYKKLDYSTLQRLYSYYRDGEDAFLMTKGL